MMTTARPKFLNIEDRREVARALAARLIAEHSSAMPETNHAIDHLVQVAVTRSMDGYEIAKALDGTYYRWDCNLALANDLDEWSSLYDKKLKERQREWAATIDFGPPLVAGTRVTAVWGGAQYPGVVKEVYEYGPAQYVIEIDGRDSRSGGAIVDFENVTPL